MDNAIIMCPIRMLEYSIRPTIGTLEEKFRCFRACAWYDADHECCAVLSLARSGGVAMCPALKRMDDDGR